MIENELRSTSHVKLVENRQKVEDLSITCRLHYIRGTDLARSSPLWKDSRSECESTLMSSPPGNLEKRYLINFRQVGVIVLQSRRVNGQVFEPQARGSFTRT